MLIIFHGHEVTGRDIVRTIIGITLMLAGLWVLVCEAFVL